MPPLDATLDDQRMEQRYVGDDKLYVVFYMKAVQSGFKTEKEGRPIFDDVPHIKIYAPGDKTTVIDVPVEPQHKQRFATRWEKFEKGLAQSPEGTPVEQWPLITTAQAHEFKAMNLFTVEQIAGMPDTAAQRFMGGHELRRKATAFLAQAKDSAEAQRLATQNAEQRERLTRQDEQINRLSAQVEALMQKAEIPASSAPVLTGKGQQRERTPAGTAGA